jgi:hypothetical protein
MTSQYFFFVSSSVYDSFREESCYIKSRNPMLEHLMTPHKYASYYDHSIRYFKGFFEPYSLAITSKNISDKLDSHRLVIPLLLEIIYPPSR